MNRFLLQIGSEVNCVDYPVGDCVADDDWGFPRLAVQPRLGLLPERRPDHHPHYSAGYAADAVM